MPLKFFGKSGDFFPNVSSLAEFRPDTLTINFNYLTRENFSEIRKLSKLMGSDRTAMQTVLHELTHWSDMVSTVWGQNYLEKLFDAHRASRSYDENEFFKTIDLFDESRRILFPLYYHVIEKDASRRSVNHRWGIEFSCGQEFDSNGRINTKRPIYFIKFNDRETGRQIARQPLTVGALLETSAMWSELQFGLETLSNLDDGERAVEAHAIQRELAAILYDENYTVYTAPAHMLAYIVQNNDSNVIFERSAFLASVALNLITPHFTRIIHPDIFWAFGERLPEFLNSQNRGYIFAVLAHFAGEIDFSLPTSEWGDQVLRKANLPSYLEIMSDAQRHLRKKMECIQGNHPFCDLQKYFLNVGLTRSELRKDHSFKRNKFDTMNLALHGPTPLMFDRNLETFAASNDIVNDAPIDMHQFYDINLELRSFTENFLQGCRNLQRNDS